MTASATPKASRKTAPKPVSKKAARKPHDGNPHPVERDSDKIIFRVSSVVMRATKKWVKREGFNGVATAGRVAIIRVLRNEGFLKHDEH